MGQQVVLQQSPLQQGTSAPAAAVLLCRALDGAGQLIALAELGADGVLRSRRGFNLASIPRQVDANAPE